MVDLCEIVMSRVPILVILGATGSGKSRLGIELAQRFSGEIISADSMQVYKGLDIITAKVTKEERAMAPHHMLDICDPLTHCSVVDFRNKALPIMDNLLSTNKLPIIVGGTNYYIESLLWEILVQDPEESVKTSKNADWKISSDLSCDKKSDNVSKSDSDNANVNERDDDEQDHPPKKKMKLEESNKELHRKLAAIDPEMANRLHPNNRRKVIRSLQVHEEYGMRHSEILRIQRLAGGSGLGGPLRYQNSIILWLQCDQKILDDRLNARVDSMLEAGLVKELLDFHERYNQDRLKNNALPDYTKGIFQSIGFKEFHEYLILPKEQRESETGKKLLQQGIDDLKLVTRRYARKQQRWVLNRFVRRADRQRMQFPFIRFLPSSPSSTYSSYSLNSLQG
ncbi:tRNA dimethylallyltransferase isoform X2 [Cephus cinctus]|uniref:tRNA dimethylallyltransferase isoform X2 n=1 Tax=Cephus cinctus TaxID=211228 RepID=A0AAJ7VY74_CEPCN|nr:tRNA dimethylallyltransferase isoform X2 [Cephus cinctus]